MSLECHICGGEVPIDKPYGQGACLSCGQEYDFDEGYAPILRAEQKAMLAAAANLKRVDLVQLIADLAANPPMEAAETDDSLYCHFCNGPEGEHAKDCPYIRALDFLGEMP